MVVLRSKPLVVALFALFLVLAIALPSLELLEKAEIFLSTLIVFFTITAGFTLATVWNEYTDMREAVSAELGEIENVFFFVKRFGKKTSERFAAMLDSYLMVSLVVPFSKFSKTNKLFYKMQDFTLRSINPKNSRERLALDKLWDGMQRWEAHRETQTILGPSRVPRVLWLALISLAAGTITYMYLIKVDSAVSVMVTTLVSFSISLTLLVIRELDEYTFGDFPSYIEATEEMFDLIGKQRFYWPPYVRKGYLVPPKGTKYRTTLQAEAKAALSGA